MRHKFFLTSIIIASILFILGFKYYGKSKKSKIATIEKKGNTAAVLKKKPDSILLVNMAFEESYLINPIKEKVKSFYHIPVKSISAELPAFAFFKPRNRYRADSLLNYLAALNKGQYRFVAGLTSKDISCTNGNVDDWGVFGLGSLSAKGCVTSSFRLRKKASVSLLTERIQKVVLHEIGHNYGLEHCTSAYPCFMKAADGKISEVDAEPMDMCKICRQRINL